VPDAIRRRRLDGRWLALALWLLLLLLVNLGNHGLHESDEGRYAGIAREMLEGSHGWWVPYMSDVAHLDKPPLVYWTTAVAFEVFGEHEWAARLPSVLGAMLTLIGVGWAAWRMYGSGVAWWSVLLCGTMVQFLVLARLLTPDMLLTGFVTLAVAFWVEARRRSGHVGWWAGCALCWSLAWWTKATAALVPLLGLALGLAITRDRAGLRALRPLRLLAIVLAVGAFWYVDMVHRNPDLLGFFLGRELVGRIVGHPDGRHGPWFYHLALSLAMWAPWWPIALVMAARNFRAWTRRRDLWRRAPIELWISVTVLIVFSLISSKLPSYTLPAAPWVAVACARVFLRQRPDERAARFPLRPVLAGAALVSALLVVGSVYAPRFESRLGINSSLREVGKFLHARGADAVYLDRYAPGIEFYFGEHVFYVTREMPIQFPGDTGWCDALGEPHFVAPEALADHLRRHREADLWVVRLKRNPEWPLGGMLRQTGSLETVRIGDFQLDHLPRMARAAPEH
jgi:4-amino-4-deoxy-L-arabinose transferase-like glycosyltransferase